MSSTAWRSYEEVAAFLLTQFRDYFGLKDVEGKQKIKGLRSRSDWQIDAKGRMTGDGEMFVIVECRRHTSSGQKQEQLGSLAYRITDTSAAGGIMVSPLPLQEGAKKVAQAEHILEVTLNKDCTTTKYVMQFLDRLLVGASDGLCTLDSVDTILNDANGN